MRTGHTMWDIVIQVFLWADVLLTGSMVIVASTQLISRGPAQYLLPFSQADFFSLLCPHTAIWVPVLLSSIGIMGCSIFALVVQITGFKGQRLHSQAIYHRTRASLSYGRMTEMDSEVLPALKLAFEYSRFTRASIRKAATCLGYWGVGFGALMICLLLCVLLYYDPNFSVLSSSSVRPYHTVAYSDTHAFVQINWEDSAHPGSNLILMTSEEEGGVSYAPLTTTGISHVSLSVDPGVYRYGIRYFDKAGTYTLTIPDPEDPTTLVFLGGLYSNFAVSRRLKAMVPGDSNIIIIGGATTGTKRNWERLLTDKGVLHGGMVAIGRGGEDVPTSEKDRDAYRAMMQNPQCVNRLGPETLDDAIPIVIRLPYSAQTVYRDLDLTEKAKGLHFHFVRGATLVIVLDMGQDFEREVFLGCPRNTILHAEQILYLDDVLRKYSPELHPEIAVRIVTVYGALYDQCEDSKCTGVLSSILEELGCQFHLDLIFAASDSVTTLYDRTARCREMGHDTKLSVVQLTKVGRSHFCRSPQPKDGQTLIPGLIVAQVLAERAHFRVQLYDLISMKLVIEI
ncbi:hypothetical protein GMRT_11118 [Giardia muris]|uniref:Uncharacterized protein n=1 Tax=Giardia muris TaxID=5742 RepID=A0A4Z1T8N7_GIAMU|nr:hypothetical protein GMRT_11118 [Giardia muris]|eukprot:TNJ28939.1 hypothetical protein GMRT_11118 [Giardia muris]